MLQKCPPCWRTQCPYRDDLPQEQPHRAFCLSYQVPSQPSVCLVFRYKSAYDGSHDRSSRRWNRNPARSRIQSDKHSPGSLQRNRAPGALSTADRYPSVFDTSVHCHSLQAHTQFLLSPDRGWYTHRSSPIPGSESPFPAHRRDGIHISASDNALLQQKPSESSRLLSGCPALQIFSGNLLRSSSYYL